ncbi:taste receptor type 2 member 7-like [Macrotis lagotis]|uniref:taste receptor type 2 member 7-like n=1 Tax=Macrotis lagotis TaxID=92651 RepID=UPI003D694AA7
MGIWINIFIFLVNCIDWVKSRKFSLVNSILMSLAFSRIFLLWIMLITGVMRAFYSDTLVNKETTLILLCLYIMANDSSDSLVTCLNVFYFLKIAHFSHPLFLWFKWRINRVVLMILLGFLIIFLFLTPPMMVKFMDDNIGSMERKIEQNHTKSFQTGSLQVIVAQILLSVGRLIILVISPITCFLLILFLWKHARQMQFNAMGFRDPRTEAHIRVMGWLVSCLFLIILYYVGIFITESTSSILEQRLTGLLGFAIAGSYPSGHSVILILGNSKLKQASLWVWHQALFFLRGGKP